MELENLLNPAKQFLSIVTTSTSKDDEIKILIESAKLELERCGIDIMTNYDRNKNTYDSLIKTAILFFVKSHFGNVDLKEKEYSLRTFETLEQSLSLSDDYRKRDDSNESS